MSQMYDLRQVMARVTAFCLLAVDPQKSLLSMRGMTELNVTKIITELSFDQ